jgi:hypothetical protein
MAKIKASRTRITTSQSKILPLRRRKIRRMRVASCAVPDHWAKRCPNRKGRTRILVNGGLMALLYYITCIVTLDWISSG